MDPKANPQLSSVNSKSLQPPIPPRRFAVLFAVEILVIVVAVTFFSLIQNKFVAGMWAGQVFVLLGLWILLSGIRSSAFRKTATFWLGCASLFLTALPLMITRMLNYTLAFEQVNVLGIPGPIFHHISTALYFTMMAGTVFDLVQSYRTKKWLLEIQ